MLGLRVFWTALQRRNLKSIGQSQETSGQVLMKKCLTGEVRERLGLNILPQEYNQYANECENSIVKKPNDSKCKVKYNWESVVKNI